jgi:peptide/nickel transport system substrate-binding protein
MNKLIYLGVAMCLMITVILVGCTNEPKKPAAQNASNDPSQISSSEPTRGGTLKMVVENVTTLGYPAEQRISAYLYYVQPVFETLGRYDEKGVMKPWLAENWQIDADKKTITIKLKQGIKFHDDTDFNAEALKWNIEEYQKNKRPEVNGIQSLEVVDANTLRITLENWDSTFLNSLAYYVKIASPTAITKNGKEWAAKNPVGTGPFKFVSWDRNVSIKFKKNENYWIKGKPYLDGIEYQIIDDFNTAANVFKSGAADVLRQTTSETFRELEATGKYVTSTDEKLPGAYIGVGLMYDSGNPASPFADVKVRQAVMHAVDSNAIAKSVLKGMAIPTNQFSSPASPFYNPDVKGYTYDPEKAKQLLAEAGYPNGFKTKITTDTQRLPFITAVQTYLAKVGIDAQIVTVDLAKWTSLVTDKWDGMIMFIRVLEPNPTNQMYRLFNKNGALYVKNMVHPDKVEKMLIDAKSAPTPEAQKKIVQELQKVVFDEYALGFPTFAWINGIVTQPKVQNLGMNTTYALDWTPEEVWMKK